ncbi:cell division protein FtsK [Lactiplantibacillus garii]|uniref:DNA translocase FtsK n=1 Tax=Lactiplantibacillus garii TaxID=2306423 RepID=A0A426D5N8_9LACO|nr:DNA translocase FtsK [Lactiplantibacillus garii]RRK09891.1 cell division protein FtsK [Lactiplantibacillus garii]
MNHYDGPAFFRKYRLTTPQVNTSAAASQSTPAASSASTSTNRPATPVHPAKRATVKPTPPVRSRAAKPAANQSAKSAPTSNAPFSGGTHGAFHPSKVPSQLSAALTDGGIIRQKDDKNYLEIEASLHKSADSFLLFADATSAELPTVDLQRPVPATSTAPVIEPTSSAPTEVFEPHAAGFSDQPTEVFEPQSQAASAASTVAAPDSGPTVLIKPTAPISAAPASAPTEVFEPHVAAQSAQAESSAPRAVTVTSAALPTVVFEPAKAVTAAKSEVATVTSSAPTEVFEPTQPVMDREPAGPTVVFEPTHPISATEPEPVTSAATAELSAAESAVRPSHGLGLSLGAIMSAEHDAQSDLAPFKDKPVAAGEGASASSEADSKTSIEATPTTGAATTTAPAAESTAASQAPTTPVNDDDEPYQPVGMRPQTTSQAAQDSTAPVRTPISTASQAGPTSSAAQSAPASASVTAPTSAVHSGESAAPVLADKELAAYHFPPLSLLKPPVILDESEMDDWIEQKATALEETLSAFKINANVVDWTVGPTITQFQVKLARGIKVSKITNLEDDIKMALEAKQLRIEAPIPGRNTVGIEIPNKKSRPVMLSEVLNSKPFKESKSPLTVALGVDLFGQPQVTDLRKMPHGLIAGSTGSGKSVFINSILVSLLYRANPQQVKLLLIDPKAVELAPYNKIPYLLAPVISDPKAASAALKWAVDEMDNRYDRLAAGGARNIEQFNRLAEEHHEPGLKMPYIVIVIDELADLMMVASSEFQDYIARITAKARAAGIHLLVATQRPSVDVVTGVIKNNIPTRIAFMTSSQVDSRTVLDTSGAEQLLGRGDMLYLGNGQSNPMRLQGTFVDREIDDITQFVRDQAAPHYEFQPDSLLKHEEAAKNEDELMPEVLAYIADEDTTSTSKVQRNFSIGYNRAANMVDDLESRGYVSAAKGSKPRDVYFTADDLTKLQANS